MSSTTGRYSASNRRATSAPQPATTGCSQSRAPERPHVLRRFWSERNNRVLAVVAVVFLVAFSVPWSAPRISAAVQESFLLLHEYAQEHVLLCLVPALFIAGAIATFLNRQAVITYLGPQSPKAVAYAVASVSGTILAVCSCTVLPLFKGIYRKGAGLGPAVSFLYSGPAINVLAIVLTARVLGLQLGIARAVGAIVFAVAVGLFMHLIHIKEDSRRVTDASMFQTQDSAGEHSPLPTLMSVGSMVAILLFLNWAPSGGSLELWDALYRWRWLITAFFALILLYTLIHWFKSSELREWIRSTRDFAAQILPLLFAGILVAGFLLGRPGHTALIPQWWIAGLVGTNSLLSNLIASVAGTLMYFATLTEVPIMQGLLGAGMNKGPALALLLAGPSLSLPSLLVIGGELGLRKTLTYGGLVVAMSTGAGLIYGTLFA